MDYPLGPTLVLGIVVALAVMLFWLAARARRRAAVMASSVLIGRAMDRRGITPADAEAAGLESEIAAAGTRCAECANAALCRSWLLAGRRERFPATCPNSKFFEEIQSHLAICNKPTER